MKKVILNVMSVLVLLMLSTIAFASGYLGWVDSQSGCQFNFMAGLLSGWCGATLFFALLLTGMDYIKIRRGK